MKAFFNISKMRRYLHRTGHSGQSIFAKAARRHSPNRPLDTTRSISGCGVAAMPAVSAVHLLVYMLNVRSYAVCDGRNLTSIRCDGDAGRRRKGADAEAGALTERRPLPQGMAPEYDVARRATKHLWLSCLTVSSVGGLRCPPGYNSMAIWINERSANEMFALSS